MHPLTPNFKSRFRILKGGKISLVVSAFFSSSILAYAAPSGGVIVSGSANISTLGSVTTIDQSSQKTSINWQNFSIGANETVNFNQPNASAIALNRVVGNERSIIDGALNANGQVWLLNANGVLFGKNAAINTAGLLATTKDISDEAFQAGDYTFSGNSSQSIINLGTLHVSDGAYVALLGKEVINEGIIRATLGDVHVRGAEEFTLNLNGNSLVNLTVHKGTLDALVENKGAIIADGGEIYLTTSALDEVLNGVVNNTGTIQANTMQEVDGKIVLFAHGGTGEFGGTIEAVGGFVETSGEIIDIDSTLQVKAKEWLIDPTDITIDDATAYNTSLNNGTNVTVQTVNTGSGNGDITLNTAITKSSGSEATLTLAAHRNIYIKAAISGSTGSPLNVVLAARATGGADGAIGVMSDIKSYGGDITMGGGDLQASGFAIANSASMTGMNASTQGSIMGIGFRTILNTTTQVIIDARTDPTASKSTTTALASQTGGNIVMRGKGSSTIDNTNGNWGVYLSPAGVYTAGAGTIDIEGHGGLNTTGYWGVGSVGITMGSQGTKEIMSGSGAITIKGYSEVANTKEAYGFSPSGTASIKTAGALNFIGDSLMIRSGAFDIEVGANSDIKAPMVGCSGAGCSTDYTFAKTGTGILNLWGNAQAFASATTSTSATPTSGTFTDTTNTLNVVSPTTINQALYAFSNRPSTINQVESSSATDTSDAFLTYTLTDILSGYTYKGSQYNLSSFWLTSSIFNGTDGDDLSLGTDYVFKYGGETVTGFTNANTYSDISIELLNSSFTLASSGNTNGSFTITPKEISLNASKTYDGTTNLNNFVTLNTGIAGETLSYTNAVANSKNVGAGNYVSAITLQNNQDTLASNYKLPTLNSANASVTINKAEATVTANSDLTKVYNGVAQSVSGFTASGLVNGETISVLDGVSASGTGTNAGTYDVVASGEDENYNLEFVNGSLVIAKADATITAASDVTKVYNGEAQSVSGFTATGLVNGETISVLDGVSASGTGANAGTYDVVASGEDENYNLEFVNGSLVIAPKPITVTAEDKSKISGEKDPSLTYSADGLIGDDSLNGNLVRATGESVGDYAISKGTLANSNYAIEFTNGTLAIKPNETVAKVVENIVPKTPTPTPTPTPEPTPTLENIINTTITTTTQPVLPSLQPSPVATIPPTLMQNPLQGGETIVTNTMTPLSSMGFAEGTRVTLVSKPDETKPVVRTTQTQLQVMQQLTNNEDGQDSTDVAPTIQTRVPIAQDSLIELVNGGVLLPEGVEQEFYIEERL